MSACSDRFESIYRSSCALSSLLLFALLMLIAASIPVSSQAQEWAHMDRYAQANAELGDPADDEQRVVFMGDSITEGWSQAYPEFFDGQPFINRGISGQVTAQMLVRFRQDVIDLKPKIVFILAGTNDIAQNQGAISIQKIADHIASMADLARSNGIIPVICSVLPAAEYPWRPEIDPSTEIPLLNEKLAEWSSENEVLYLDYFAEMNDGQNGLMPEFTYDEVHLTRAGYVKLSDVAWRQLNAMASGN